MPRKVENPRKPDRYGTFFFFSNYASICPASLAMGRESREGRLAAPGDHGRRRPRSPKPHGRAGGALESPWEGGGTAAPEETKRRRPALWLRAPPPGAAGNEVTWGAGLCRPLGLSAVPELIKRLFWPREAFRSPGVGRVGAACGHGNNQSHSCASTKPDAQREVNSGLLEGGFKRRHLQARPVVN